MKNAIRILVLLTFIITTNQAVFAEGNNTKNKWYARLGAGYAEQIDKYNEMNFGMTEWEFDSGSNLSVSAGRGFNYWAVEAEVSYKQMDAAKDHYKGSIPSINLEGDQTQLSVMLNCFWYPKPNWKVSPYLGAGLGLTKISWNDIRANGMVGGLDDSDTVFTYQLIIGGSINITSKVSLEVDYRYFAPDDIEVEESINEMVGKFDNQELNIFALAIKYSF